MAVPEHITVHNISGIYTLNQKQSDSMSPVLKQQGVGFLTRKVIEHSNVETTMKQYNQDDGLPRLDMVQVSTGNISNVEERVMDWSMLETKNIIWGKVKGQSRYCKLDLIEDEFLKKDWEPACAEGDIIENWVESLTDTWTARQVWGFAIVEGQRKHVRRVLAQKPGSPDERVVVVYDWKKEIES